jgi:GT2 family glycosyltransferase
MGRLGFVQQTLPRLMADPNAHCCMVDYSCPDHVGDWIEQVLPRPMQERRLVVERVHGERLFNKCRAHNAGAWRALHEGADYLCFLDADTIVEPGFQDWIRAEARPDRFLIAGLRPDGTDMPSMTGLLVVHGQAFRQVGGFDEDFRGWGGEDIELRLRLYFLGGLDYASVPLTLARPIPHDNALRSQFYEERDIASSNTRNIDRIYHKIRNEWRGRLKRDLAGSERLWYKRGWSNRLDLARTEIAEPAVDEGARRIAIASRPPEEEESTSKRLLSAAMRRRVRVG